MNYSEFNKSDFFHLVEGVLDSMGDTDVNAVSAIATIKKFHTEIKAGLKSREEKKEKDNATLS